MKPPPPESLRQLRALEPFAGLDAEAFEGVTAQVEQLQLPAGEILMRQGDVADCVFFVLDGSLGILHGTAPGEEQVLAQLGPGELVGEVAVLVGGERSATVRVTSDATLLAIPRESFLEVLEADVRSLGGLRSQVRERLRRTQLAVQVGRLFGPMDAAGFAELSAQVQWTSLNSGEVLFRAGDPADCAYIVVSGRLRIVAQDIDGGERLLNEVGRGETLGEMALLDRAPRSATAYAVRDSDLVKFPSQRFDRLLEEHPRALRHIARFVIDRLRHQSASVHSPARSSLSAAVIAASPGVAASEFATRLTHALSTHGSAFLVSRQSAERALGLRSGDPALTAEPGRIRLTEWAAGLSEHHHFLVYAADPQWTDWTNWVSGQADHILIVADGNSDPEVGEVEKRLGERWHWVRAPRRSLVLLRRAGESPTRTSAWLGPRTLDEHFHASADSNADFARLARVLTGRAVGLVLGGGGARGFAHIGVIRALADVGVPVDSVGGTSIGSIIGAGLAMGLDADRIQVESKRHFSAIFDPTLPLVSILAGRRVSSRLAGAFGELQIEDLEIPFFCVSTNLTRASETVHTRGSLAAALRASISLPGVLPPVAQKHELLIDGGVLNNLPSDVMAARLRGGEVVAVDITPEVDLSAAFEAPSELSGWSVLWQRIRPRGRALEVPHIINILARSTVVASAAARRKRETDPQASLYLSMPVAEWGMFQFGSLEAIAERGYEASLDPIRSWWAQRN